jgi:16S rRNA (cytidine1402-2'-O)-methyltransferase
MKNIAQTNLPSGQTKLPSGLYLISTPIGNLEDMTMRAVRILKEVNKLYCEDTRVAQKLLSHYGIKVKTDSYNDHNGAQKKSRIISAIENGDAIGLISDAGMPLISDPGYKLVVDLQAKGHYVTSIPGPSACLMGLQLSGVPSDQFYFGGFLPKAKQKAENYLLKIAKLEATLIFYATPHNIVDNLNLCQKVLGDRQVVIARELTKKFETIHKGSFEELKAIAPKMKGEFVLIIDGYEQHDIDLDTITDELELLLKSHSVKESSNLIHQKYGNSKRQIYEFILTHHGKK